MKLGSIGQATLTRATTTFGRVRTHPFFRRAACTQRKLESGALSLDAASSAQFSSHRLCLLRSTETSLCYSLHCWSWKIRIAGFSRMGHLHTRQWKRYIPWGTFFMTGSFPSNACQSGHPAAPFYPRPTSFFGPT